jgi:hypothetical protein
MDNNDNNERIMEEIIVGGANAFASYTDEENYSKYDWSRRRRHR